MSERELTRVVKIMGTALIAILILLFVILNTGTVNVSFVFFSADISLIWVILLSMGIGWLGIPLLWRAVRKYVLERGSPRPPE